jgi:DNA-binding MarR family transcriptional regulator
MGNNQWTFITNHAAVLTMLEQEGSLTARKIGSRLNITTRTVYRIIHDLEHEGYIKKSKQGRENHYEIIQTLPLRHKNQRDIQVRELLIAISDQKK